MSGRGEKEFKARSNSPGINGPKPEFEILNRAGAKNFPNLGPDRTKKIS